MVVSNELRETVNDLPRLLLLGTSVLAGAAGLLTFVISAVELLVM